MLPKVGRFPFEPEPAILDDTPAHRRYYQIAGVTIQVESDLPITDETFAPKFKQYEVGWSGDDMISIHHHLGLPDLPEDMGTQVYQKPPWKIFRKDGSWIYLGTAPMPEGLVPYQLAVFDDAHSDGRIYSDSKYEELYRQGGMTSLTLFPTDQILLARVLAKRQACYIHSGAVVLAGKGLAFVGHSGSGKSTIVKMLREKAEVLCDDRNIIRCHLGHFRIHGSWSHGEVPTVSANSAPLGALFFLHKSDRTRISPQKNKRIVLANLLACVVRPLLTADWWHQILDLIEAAVCDTPCYDLEFDKSGDVAHLLEAFEYH